MSDDYYNLQDGKLELHATVTVNRSSLDQRASRPAQNSEILLLNSMPDQNLPGNELAITGRLVAYRIHIWIHLMAQLSWRCLHWAEISPSSLTDQSEPPSIILRYTDLEP